MSVTIKYEMIGNRLQGETTAARIKREMELMLGRPGKTLKLKSKVKEIP